MLNCLTSLTSKSICLGLLFIFTATGHYLMAQDDDDIDLLLDELFFQEEELVRELLEAIGEQTFFYSTVSYNSNTYFSGRETGIDQFNIVPQLSFYHKSGITLAVSGIYYDSFSPNWDFTTLSGGYYLRLGPKKLVHFYGGYSHFIYSEESGVFTNSLDFNAGIRNEKRTFGLNCSSSYFFGEDNSWQFIFSPYAQVPIKRASDYSLRLKFQLNFVVAQQIIAQEEVFVIGDQQMVRITSEEVFDLLNTQVVLPLQFTTRSWDIQAGYHLNLPNPVATEANLNTTSLFSVSVGYLLGL